MARATWSGAISFGLVSVPVQLFTAVRSHSVRFKQLHEDTGAPVKQQRVDSETGDEVPYERIVKGYEVEPGRYVTVQPEELEQLDPEASRSIDILDFVEQPEIDPVYYDRAYHLVPDGPAAAKPYRLLAEAMGRSDKVAIAQLVMRNNAYLAAIRAADGLLVLSTMHYADEVADPAELGVREALEDVEVADREVAMAEQLIGSLLTSFDPERYHDDHQERVQAFLAAKAEGQELPPAAPEREPGEVVDLVAALERSLDRARGATEEPEGSRGARYAEMSKDALYELAQERDLAGRSSMSKDELVAALEDSDERAGAA